MLEEKHHFQFKGGPGITVQGGTGVLLAENDSSAFSSLVFIYFMCMTWVGQVYYSKTNSLSLAFISSIHYFMIHIVCFERKESLTLIESNIQPNFVWKGFLLCYLLSVARKPKLVFGMLDNDK
jgi:hypothetical protein